MTSAGRPLKVFLCHAHADRDRVHALYTRLTKDGVDAWLDKEKLLPGQDWELEIRKAVREADVVVVCLSKQFNQAGFRQKEVRLALDTAMEKPEGEIFIIPARLEECDTLESLRQWHWVDLFDENGYEMLTRAFQARANKIGAAWQIRQDIPSFKITNETKEGKPQIVRENHKSDGKKIVVSIGMGIIILGFVLFLPRLINTFVQNTIPTLALETTPSITLSATPSITPDVSSQSATEDSWNEIISVRMPTLNEIREDLLSVWDANGLKLGDMTSPGVLRYTGNVVSNREYLWPIYWCSIDKSTLDENILNISTVFLVNGEKIPENTIFEYYYDTNTGWKCNYRATVIGQFHKGDVITLQVIRDLATDIFDGEASYFAGSYTYELIVSVK